MADHTPVNLPDEFEELLRDSMAIEPTPQFAARVRQQIELEPRRSGWRIWFVSSASLAAAALGLLAVLPLWVGEAPLPPVAPPPPAPVAAPSTVLLSLPAILPPRVQSVRPRVAATESTQPSAFPEIMVDPRQRAALTALARLGLQGTVSEEVLEKLAGGPASVPAAIAVDPLVVSPIAVGGVLQYEIERR